MKARTWFSCEAIKKEKPNKVKCDADEIDIFSQQDETLFVPSTSLLVAVVSMTCLLFGFSSFLFECLLRRTASGARKRRWVHLFMTLMKTILMATSCHKFHRGRVLVFFEPGDCSHPCQQCSILLPPTNALLKWRGQLGSTNHSGRTAMDTSFHRGWLVFEQRVQCGNVFLSPWFFLKRFALWGSSSRPDCEHWTVSLANCDFLLLCAYASSPF